MVAKTNKETAGGDQKARADEKVEPARLQVQWTHLRLDRMGNGEGGG